MPVFHCALDLIKVTVHVKPLPRSTLCPHNYLYMSMPVQVWPMLHWPLCPLSMDYMPRSYQSSCTPYLGLQDISLSVSHLDNQALSAKPSACNETPSKVIHTRANQDKSVELHGRAFR